jgi:nitroreductase
MAILQIATSRKSTRKYKKTRVNEDDINYILETIRQSPSGSNKQPWQIIVVDNQKIKMQIRKASEEGEREFYESITPDRRKWYNEKGISPSKPMLTEAPVLFVIVGDTTAPNYKPSIWISVGYALLAAEEKGLSTVTYTPSNPLLVTKALGIPSPFIVEAILPLGYSDESKLKEPRKQIKKFTHKNKWKNA